MLYYSEITKKNYPTANDCIKAEEDFLTLQTQKKAAEEKKAKERAAANEKLEAARKKMLESRKEYFDELDKYTKKYGKTTYYSDDLSNLINFLTLPF